MERIKLVATLLLIPVAIYGIVYPYEAMLWNWSNSFHDPWQDGWRDPSAVISPATRAVFFFVWFLPLLAGVVAVFFALRLLWLMRQGVLFDGRVAKGIMGLGISITLSNALHLAAAAVSPMIKSWHNPEGPLPLRFWYSSSHIALLLYGLAFVLMGWVMYEAIKLKRDNEAFF